MKQLIPLILIFCLPLLTISQGLLPFQLANQVPSERVNTEEMAAQDIRVFPNPASHYFSLSRNYSLVNEIVVYNIIGQPVKHFYAFDNKKYYINDLPDGIYMVSMTNKEKGILKTVRIHKRGFRP